MSSTPDYGTVESSSKDVEASVPLSHEGTKDRSTAQEDDGLSLESDEAPQAGVKRIEAISTAWTKWSLAFAYIGCVKFQTED